MSTPMTQVEWGIRFERGPLGSRLGEGDVIGGEGGGAPGL